MSELQCHTEIKTGSDKSFGLVFSGFFAVIAVFPLLGGGGLRLWALAISAAFLAVALLAPKWLHRLNILWFRFGMLLSRIVSPIVMGILFYLTVTPVGLVMRAFRSDPLRKSFDADAPSYWIKVDRDQQAASSMRNQF